MTDISHQVFGKYQYCTKNKADEMWYSDDDFEFGNGGGPLLKGALPDPRSQGTPELTALAKRMHERAAAKSTDAMLSTLKPAQQHSVLGFFKWLFKSERT